MLRWDGWVIGSAELVIGKIDACLASRWSLKQDLSPHHSPLVRYQAGDCIPYQVLTSDIHTEVSKY